MVKHGTNSSSMMGLCVRANKLCIPASSIRLLLLQGAHGGGLMGHFGVKKTEDILAAHFFWSKMRREVVRFVARCTICQKAKSRLNPHDLYICLYLLLAFLGKTFLWILGSICPKNRGGTLPGGAYGGDGRPFSASRQ
jgi:hypothetical protein